MSAARGATTWVTWLLSTFIPLEMRDREGERAGKVNEWMMSITARAAPRFLKVPLTCALPLECGTAWGTCISVMARQC